MHTALLLASALLLSVPAAAQVAPDPPLPEPVGRWFGTQNGRIKVQSYRLDPATAWVPPLSIAQRHALANRLGSRPLDLVIACWIAPSGAVTDDCAPDVLRIDYTQWLKFSELPQPVFPVFPALTDPRPTPRRVEYRFRYDGAPPPPIDWTAGPLVDRAQIGPLAGNRWIEYPMRATRAQKEAKASIECQVQDDLSIACRTLGVVPAEQAAVFSDAGEYQLIPGRAPATLADGRSSIGARARFDLDFRLPPL